MPGLHLLAVRHRVAVVSVQSVVRQVVLPAVLLPGVYRFQLVRGFPLLLRLSLYQAPGFGFGHRQLH